MNFVLFSRNIEEILAEQGESVKRVLSEDGTMEVALEDIIGEVNKHKIKSDTEWCSA